MISLDGVTSIADILRARAKTNADDVALILGDRETTYKGLDEAANKVAQGLLWHGVKPDDRVAYLGKNTDLYFEVLLGAMKTNSVVVGINARLAPPEIAYVLNDSGSKVLFVGKEWYPVIEKIKGQCPQLTTVIALDEGHAEFSDYSKWRDAYKAEDPKLPHKPDDDIIQLYTSGTTGHPKGVQLTNHNYIALLENGMKAGYADWKERDVVFLCMPLFHVAGVNIGLLGLAQGCRNVILKDLDPGIILDLIEKHRIQKIFLVPAVINMLVLVPGVRERNLSSVELMLYGASPIAEQLLIEAQDIFQGVDFIQVYGMTETCGAGTFLAPEDHDPARGKLRSCGKPGDGVEIRIAGPNGEALPAHEVGEILIKGEMVMRGYWNKPEATEKSVVDGWMHTGDAGYQDEEGFVFIYDRVKDMIVSGGENIYPAEVENAVFAHPAVADVAVIGVPDEKWGEAVKAIVVLKPGMEVTEEELREFCRERIAGYKVPKSVDFVDELPRNPSGKILRRELRAPYWEGSDRQVN